MTGWLKDFTGNFTAARFVIGAIFASGSIATLMLPWVKAPELVPPRQEREVHA